MDDNPSLSENVKARYRGMYSGVFYRRFILGEWAAADGLVYPMFSEQMVVQTLPENLVRFVISVDYGTMNPFSAGLWARRTASGTGCVSFTTTDVKRAR